MEKAHEVTLIIRQKILSGDKERHCGHITLNKAEREEFEYYIRELNRCTVNFFRNKLESEKVKSDIAIYECNKQNSCQFGSRRISEFILTFDVT